MCNGRKIKYKIKDDGYNPANTQKVVRELVLQDKVFAILNGLGTPTHTSVLDFLKTNKVPDLFVASGSRSWNQPAKYPDTFGLQRRTTRSRGKIPGIYIKKNFAGKKVCFFGQDDDFGARRAQGSGDRAGRERCHRAQRYVVTNTNVGPQIGKLKAAGCEVVQLATVPGFTALALGTAAKLDFKPQWVSTTVGADLTTAGKGALGDGGLRCSKGCSRTNYLPDAFDDNRPVDQGVQEDKRAVQRQRAVQQATRSTAWPSATCSCRP